DLRVLVSPSLSAEWTDNVQLVQSDPEGDFILTPRLDFHAFHPIGEANVLTLDLGLGYSKYFKHDELDRLNVTPGSSVSLDLYIKEIRFNFHNRLTYQLDPTLAGAVSGVAEYGGLDNTTGVLATWNLNKAVVNFGYDFVRFISSSSQFDY